MRDSDKIDEVMLTAFVDDQLDAANCETIIKAMDVDEDLRDQVYRLRKTKDLMKLGYGDASYPDSKPKNFVHPFRSQCLTRFAAVFILFAIGLGTGVTGYKYFIQEGYLPVHNLADLTQKQGERIILHISESDTGQFETTLAYIEKFLKQHKSNGKAQIEVVANAGGIDLLRADFPLSNKVADMMDEYDNITFIACTNAINTLRSQGYNPSMIKSVETEKAALAHIIDRLQDGWTYIKADSEAMKI